MPDKMLDPKMFDALMVFLIVIIKKILLAGSEYDHMLSNHTAKLLDAYIQKRSGDRIEYMMKAQLF